MYSGGVETGTRVSVALRTEKNPFLLANFDNFTKAHKYTAAPRVLHHGFSSRRTRNGGLP